MGDPAVVKVFDTTLRDGEQSPGAYNDYSREVASRRSVSTTQCRCHRSWFSCCLFQAILQLSKRLQAL